LLCRTAHGDAASDDISRPSDHHAIIGSREVSIYAYAPSPVLSNALAHHTIAPTPPPDAPLAVKQAFMQSLTRDPRLKSRLPVLEPVLEDEINVFLDWTRPINAKGEFGGWEQTRITRFLLDYIACNFYRGKEPNPEAILKLSGQSFGSSGESLFLSAVRTGNLTIVNPVLNAHCKLGHCGLSGLTEEQFVHCLSFLSQIHFSTEAVLRFFVFYLHAAPETRSIFGDNDGRLLLDRAIEKGDLATVLELLEIGPLHKGARHLLAAVECRAWPDVVEAVIRACLGHGYSVNDADQVGQTALYLAIWFSNYEIAELLLGYGADVNLMPSYAGDTKLIHVALDGIDGRCVELLLPKFGGNIVPYLKYYLSGELDGEYIESALAECKIAYIETLIAHELVDLKDYSCFDFVDKPFPNWIKAKLVRILVSNGASVDDGFRDFPSLLHYAIAQRGSTWLLRALVVGGLNLDAAYYGQRPLEIAISMQNSDAYELLYAAGARA
jgi:ankyrin repeat protein